MTNEDLYKINFRYSEVEKRLKKIRSAAMGTSVDIRSYFQNENGRFSEQQFRTFLDKLLPEDIESKEKSFYEEFLYCVFRSYGNEVIQTSYLPETGGVYEVFRPCSSFQDILDKAFLVDKDYESYKDLDSLLKDEAKQISKVLFGFDIGYETESKGFFFAMDVLYKMLTNENPIFDNGKHLENEQIWDDVFLPPDIDLDVTEDDINQNEKNMSVIDREWTDLLAEADAYVKGMNVPRERAWKMFIDTFEGKDEFIKKYKAYRKSFFELSDSFRKGFRNQLEGYIMTFLHNKEVNYDPCGDKIYELITTLDAAVLLVDRKRNEFVG